jgi:hypothetical protein
MRSRLRRNPNGDCCTADGCALPAPAWAIGRASGRADRRLPRAAERSTHGYESDTVARMMEAFAKLVTGMKAGATWELMGQADAVKALLEQVFDERIHRNDWGTYQLRANLQKKPDVASYAGFIVDEGNPTSGPYQGTSFVWFPGDGGSVVALVIGTDGFGADTAILGRLDTGDDFGRYRACTPDGSGSSRIFSTWRPESRIRS